MSGNCGFKKKNLAKRKSVNYTHTIMKMCSVSQENLLIEIEHYSEPKIFHTRFIEIGIVKHLLYR